MTTHLEDDELRKFIWFEFYFQVALRLLEIEAYSAYIDFSYTKISIKPVKEPKNISGNLLVEAYNFKKGNWQKLNKYTPHIFII